MTAKSPEVNLDLTLFPTDWASSGGILGCGSCLVRIGIAQFVLQYQFDYSKALDSPYN
jgi:hypothetical protein